MIIKNYSTLCTNKRKQTVLDILEYGLKSAYPDKLLKLYIKKNKIKIGAMHFDLDNYDDIYLVAFGKSADYMTKIVNSALKIKSGYVVIPNGSKSVIKNRKFKIIHSGHPVPNQKSLSAAKTILNFVNSRDKKDFIIFLVSGGASSLLSLPNGITLNEKKQLTELLLKSGASIQEINCVRKHLSHIKGGKLAQKMKCDAISFVMSDVLGNDLSTIASGYTYFDKSTFADAIKVIKKYSLEKLIAKKIIRHLSKGKSGLISETPKKPKIKNVIVSSNCDCLQNMQVKAKRLGYATKTITIKGDVGHAAKTLVSLISNKSKSCLIFGGETTVKVTGNGKGGRNQELVLRILQELKNKKENVTVASLGTDGIDGNTNYAGAISDKLSQNTHAELYLKNNDSNSFFRKHGGLIKTGHTHTNLMDIGLICK